MADSTRFGPLARAVLRTQSDDRLVALVRDGTEAAFEEIVRRYRAPLVAFAAAYGPPDPEDVVQESLTRSWEALRESNTEMNLKPWLYTIVRNRALNARRDARPTQQLPDGLDGVRQPPDVVLERDELERALAAVSALPEAQRQALVRSALEGHTHEQIATAIGATPGSVRQLIYRARIAVRHGVGAVIPLPLVAAIAQAGSGAGAGAVAGAGGAATGGAIGGASFAGKALAVAAIGAVAAGSGVAIERAVTAGQRGEQHSDAAPGLADRTGGPAPSERASSTGDTATLTPVDGQAQPSATQASGAAGSSGSSSGSSASGAASTSGPSPSGPSSPSSGPGGDGGFHSSSGSDGPGPSAQPPSGPSGPGQPGSDSSGPGGHGSDDAVASVETEDHSGPGDGDDPIEPIASEIETEAVEPDEDHSGPGGDDGLDDHSGPGGGPEPD